MNALLHESIQAQSVSKSGFACRGQQKVFAVFTVESNDDLLAGRKSIEHGERAIAYGHIEPLPCAASIVIALDVKESRVRARLLLCELDE